MLISSPGTSVTPTSSAASRASAQPDIASWSVSATTSSPAACGLAHQVCRGVGAVAGGASACGGRSARQLFHFSSAGVLALEAQHRHGRGVEPEEPALVGRLLDPARGQHAQRVAVGEDERCGRARAPAPTTRSSRADDLVGGLAARRRVRPHRPARARSRGSPRSSRPRSRRRPTRRGPRRPRRRGSRPARPYDAHVAAGSSARGRTRTSASRGASAVAASSPVSVSGRSVTEVCRPSRLHSVSPCRTTQSSGPSEFAPPEVMSASLPRAPGGCHDARHDAADLRRARRAIAAAFATQGLVFISLTTRLPGFPDRWDLSELDAVRRAADDGAARRRRLAGRRAARAARSDSAAVLRAGLLVVAVAVAGADRSRPTAAGLRRRPRGVRRGAGRRRRDQQHAGGRPRAPVRPAVLPSFHGAWTFGGIVGAGVTLATGGRPRGRRPRWSPCCRCWRSSRRTSRRDHGVRPTATATCRPVAADRAGRAGAGALLHGRHGRGDLGTGLPRRRLRRPRGPGRAGDAPLPRGERRWCGWPATGLVARYGAVRVLRVGAVVAFVALASWCSRPTWPVAVLGFTLLGARRRR